jgi:hypothetical protein
MNLLPVIYEQVLASRLEFWAVKEHSYMKSLPGGYSAAGSAEVAFAASLSYTKNRRYGVFWIVAAKYSALRFFLFSAPSAEYFGTRGVV